MGTHELADRPCEAPGHEASAEAVPERVQVVVVGAGPAGAVLAYLLASRGIEVLLIERQEDFRREFRGEVVLPSGREVLAQLGIDDALHDVPGRAPEAVRAFFDGRLFLDETLDPDLFDGTPPLAISQPGLLEALVGEARRQPTFHFLRGRSVKQVVREGARVVGVEIARAGGADRVLADLVVGTDGRASAVRRSGGFEIHRQELPMDIVWGKLPPLPGDAGRAVVRVFGGPGSLLIAYVSHDDQLQVAWVIFKGTFGALRSRGIEAWVEQMAEHVEPDLAAHLRAHRDEVRQPFLLATAADCVARWSQPGVLVLGDAAHTMSPVGGQGINIALRDALAAANELVPVLSKASGASALDAACHAIELRRAPEVHAIQRFQAIPPRVLFGHGFLPGLVRRSLPWLLRTPLPRLAGPRIAQTFLQGIGDLRLEV